MNSDTVQLLKSALSRGEIILPRSPRAGRQVAAAVIYFILLFGLGLALLVWRVVLRPNDPSQMRWDLALSALFLASGSLVGGKIWWLLRRASVPFVVGVNGIERKGNATELIGWTEVAEVYVMPFVVVARSAKGGWMSVGAYTAGFAEIKSLFEAIVAGGRTGAARLGAKQQITDAIEALYRGQAEGRT